MNALNIITKNASTILTVVGMVSMGGAAVLSAMATPKALLKIEKLKEEVESYEKTVEYDEEGNLIEKEAEPKLKPLDYVKVTWMDYLPAAACVAGGVACIIIAKRIDAAKIAALTSTAMLLDEKLQLRDKAMKALPEDVKQKVDEVIRQEDVKESGTPPWDEDEEAELAVANSGERMMLCLESVTGQYFWSNPDLIRRAENEFNHYLASNGVAAFNDSCASLNDWLGFLNDNLNQCNIGYGVGWSIQHQLEVKLDTTLTENERPVLVVEYYRQPKLMDDRFCI